MVAQRILIDKKITPLQEKRFFYSNLPHFIIHRTSYKTIKRSFDALKQRIVQTRAELVSTERELSDIREILSASPNPLLIADASLHILFVNKAWEKLTGFSVSTVEGKSLTLVPPFLSEKTMQKLLKKINTGKYALFEHQIKTKKTKQILEFIFYSVKRNNQPKFYVQIGHDITARKKFELLQSQFSSLVLSSHDAIIGTEKENIIKIWNPAAEKLYGYKEKDIIGQSLNIIIPEHKKKEKQKLFEKLWQGSIIQNFETERLHKSGKIIPVSLTISPIKGKNTITGFSTFARDITGKKHLENLHNEFFSFAAHELKTPITTLKLLSQIHVKKYKRDGIQTITLQELQLMDKELSRLTRLIDDILDEERIQTGKLRLRLEEVDLIILLKDIISQMKIIAQEHNFMFVNKEKKCHIFADPDRLKQVITNILTNAVKFSKEHSTITLSLEKQKKSLRIAISDNGIGIPKEKITYIFDRFYQVNSISQNGFGIGLYLAHEIIKQHKGKLSVKSKEGKGSTFTIVLPLLH